MKKSLMVAVALTALAASSSANALDVRQARRLVVDGLSQNIGTLNLIALGTTGGAWPGSCQYLAAWVSPFNPNDVVMCTLNEQKTNFYPSCQFNETHDVISSLSAAKDCTGFDLLGQPRAGVQVFLGESPTAPRLRGIIITSAALNQFYPITA
jgi:hypothetical protein